MTHILLAILAIGVGIEFLLFFWLRKRRGGERKLGNRFNNVAWNIAVYGTDEAFRDELKHWRWKRTWKKKLFRLRGRRIEIAEYWVDRKAKNLLPV